MWYWIINLSISLISLVVSSFFTKWYFAVLIGIAVHLGLCLFFLIEIILISLTIPMKNYTKPSKFYNFVLNKGYLLICAYGHVTIKTSGIEKLPNDKCFLLVSNHLSKFDNMITSIALKKHYISWISKKENFKIPFAKHYMKRAMYLCLDRGNHKQGLDIMTQASDLIKSNTACVGVYPEGTRGNGIELRTFKSGCFKPVLWAECPLVVVAVQGTEKIHKQWFYRNTKVSLEVLEVIPFEQLKDKNTVELSTLAQSIIEKKLKENQ